jgi:hypothetical protein
MKHRFFLDGVHIAGDELAVYQGVESSPSILPHPADSPLAFPDLAAMVTKLAVDFLATQFLVEHRFFHGQTFQIGSLAGAFFFPKIFTIQTESS